MNIVKQLRERKGMQQKELALRIGVSQPTVSEWEHGKKDPSGDRLRSLSRLFGVSPLEILCFEDSFQDPKSEPSLLSDAELRFALFRGAEGITEADFEEVKHYAEYVIERRKKQLKK